LAITALTVALVTFALVFGGALLGMYFRNVLLEHHLREDVRDVIKLSTGLIGTMAALVLGLLIASAKSSYDAKSTEIKQITANIILLDLELELATLATHGQTIRVVVKYIDDQPGRLHENFKLLVLEALQKAWPCER
jgi:hypothetical protein